MTPENPASGQLAGNAEQQGRSGIRCLLAAPWGRLIVGDDPVPVALLLVFALLLLPPILGVGLGLLLLAAVAVVRAWLWCRAGRRNAGCDEPAGGPGDG